MNSVLIVLREQWENRYMIHRLALYELKSNHAGNVLGLFWMFLNPFIQVMLYWLIFGMGIRAGAPVDGIPFFIWLICGIIPWFYISAGIGQGANSIYAKLGMVSKMNFPLSVVPTYILLGQLYTHILLVITMIILVIIYQGIENIHLFALVYYIISTSCFLFVLSFITSTLSTLVRDVRLIIQSIVRMLFFFTPIFWVPSTGLPYVFQLALKMNPLYYVIEGYRHSLLLNSMESILSWYTLYFWLFVIVMLLIGSVLHIKFRRKFVDYL